MILQSFIDRAQHDERPLLLSVYTELGTVIAGLCEKHPQALLPEEARGAIELVISSLSPHFTSDANSRKVGTDIAGAAPQANKPNLFETRADLAKLSSDVLFWKALRNGDRDKMCCLQLAKLVDILANGVAALDLEDYDSLIGRKEIFEKLSSTLSKCVDRTLTTDAVRPLSDEEIERHFRGSDESDNLTRTSNAAVDLIRDGKLDDAEQISRRLIVRFPDVPDGWDRLGMVYQAKGDNRRAAECYRNWIDLIRADPDGYEPDYDAELQRLVDELDPPAAT
jgi:tetratricopeptide (TPR) repeat protein